MGDVKSLVADPEFQRLDVSQKRSILQKAIPEISGLDSIEQEKVYSKLIGGGQVTTQPAQVASQGPTIGSRISQGLGMAFPNVSSALKLYGRIPPSLRPDMPFTGAGQAASEGFQSGSGITRAALDLPPGPAALDLPVQALLGATGAAGTALPFVNTALSGLDTQYRKAQDQMRSLGLRHDLAPPGPPSPVTDYNPSESTGLNFAKELGQVAQRQPISLPVSLVGAAAGTKIKGGPEIHAPSLGPITDIKNAIFNRPKLSEEVIGRMPVTKYSLPKTTPPAAVTAMQRSMGQYLREGGNASETASRALDTVTDAGFKPTNAYDDLIATKITINRLGPKLREMAQQVGDEQGLQFKTRNIARDVIEDYIKSKNGFRGIQNREQIISNLREKYESLKNETIAAEELFQNISTRSEQLGSKAKKVYGEFLGEERIAKGDPDLWGDKLVLDAMRNKLVEGVESGGGNNVAYREMRRNYGALIRAYDAKMKRLSVVERQNALSLYEGLGLLGAATHIANPSVAGLSLLAGKGIKLYNNIHSQTSKAYRITAQAKARLPKSQQAAALAEPTVPLRSESPGYEPPQDKATLKFQANELRGLKPVYDANGNIIGYNTPGKAQELNP